MSTLVLTDLSRARRAGVVMNCPRCQQDNPAQAKFCLVCGLPLDSPATGASYTELQAEIESLKRSLTEAAEQQTAIAEILRVISRSPTDIQPVFETLLQPAVRLCAAEYAALFRFDGSQIHLVAAHNLPLDDLASVSKE